MSDNILYDKKVLVAEDNSINQLVVKHTLKKLGATADLAGDGAEAIEMFKNNPYDLILMDIQMPLMDGYEATIYIRKQLQSPVPIIAMTAFALIGEEEKCMECGMNGYVSKPFSTDSLKNAIHKILTVPAMISNNPHILGNKDVAVDVSMLYDISGNDYNYINVMVQTFLENMPNTLSKLEESLQQQDWDNIFKYSHYAKSSLSVIKISEMYDWIFTIETNARNKTNLAHINILYKSAKEKFLLAQCILVKKFGSIKTAV